nr:pms1 protein like 1 [Quercus suber]
MPIQQLAEGTVRVLGATQALTDPASVVKELLDNALDANATSVAVEISTNTIDAIQVRDSGHGIPPEDRQAVARPHCTSKITHDEDLKTIGGSSLGFRGEALASLAEVSGSLTISTRIEEEIVAVALKISRQGEVVGQTQVSHPVGTTVRVMDFLGSFAVRRQQALKNADKTLKKIQQTLQAYAFARPHVRLSLRVLKAKNDKGNWMYAPKAESIFHDTACKIVGAACASQCVASVAEARGFVMQAFLPRLDADLSKISGVGSYISVDARPVSSNRGTFKQIGKLFRDTIRSATATTDTVKDPFFQLGITCPSASYDANIEPAKDDVIFESSEDVIQLVRQLLSDNYIPKPKHVTETVQTPPVHAVPSKRTISDDENPTECVETPIRRRESFSNSNKIQFLQGTNGLASKPTFSVPQVIGARVEDNSEACSPIRPVENESQGLRRNRNDPTVSNPWVLAAMNSTTRRPPPSTEPSSSPPPRSTILRGIPRSPPKPAPFLNEQETPYLPTPRASSPYVRVPELCPADRRAPRGQSPEPGHHNPSPSVRTRLQGSPSSTVADSETAFRRLRQRNQEQTPCVDNSLALHTDDLASAPTLSAIAKKRSGTQHSPQKNSQHSRPNPPYKIPVQSSPPREKAWFDHLENADRPSRNLRRRQGLQYNDGLVEQGDLTTTTADKRAMTPPRHNRDIREFVSNVKTSDHSVASVIQKRNREQQKQTEISLEEDSSDLENSRATPSKSGFISARELKDSEDFVDQGGDDPPRAAKRRRTSERQALVEISGNAALADNEEEVDDETATPVKTTSRRRISKSDRVARTKSSRLPLESTPAGQGTHDLVCKVAISELDVARSAGKIDETLSLRGYTENERACSDTFDALEDDTGIEVVASRVHDLLVAKVSDDEMMLDLHSLLRGALESRKTMTIDDSVEGSDVETLI